MKWPKKWIDALEKHQFRITKLGIPMDEKYAADMVLTLLNEVGALKELPKPREWLWCPSCCRAIDLSVYPEKAADGFFSLHGSGQCHNMHAIKVREVLSDDEEP